jgi:hypothetical protein
LANLCVPTLAFHGGCQHEAMGQLDDAVLAHREAVAGLTALEERFRLDQEVARTRVAATRAALADAILAEATAGTAQVEIVGRTGYSRERIRQILRERGVEADR